MGTDAISPLRQRMIEDMSARQLTPPTQKGHIRACKRFAAFLKRSPDTATAEDIRCFQLHLAESGASICNRKPHQMRQLRPAGLFVLESKNSDDGHRLGARNSAIDKIPHPPARPRPENLSSRSRRDSNSGRNCESGGSGPAWA